MQRVKVGLVGIGHLGKIHLKCLMEAAETIDLVGIFDTNHQEAQSLAKTHGVTCYSDLASMLTDVEAIDIVTPTSSHYEIAKEAMLLGKHVFIEKPVTATLAEAQSLIELQDSCPVWVQVGHVERFNPAMQALRDLQINPRFIEIHRLANFNPRGTDVSVVLDLMIHDLDIILSLVSSEIKSIQANGVPLVSPTPDIGNARIEWENGCVANVTASRLSLKTMRKMRLFQNDAYIAIDFLERSAQIIRLYDKDSAPAEEKGVSSFVLDTPTGDKVVQVEMPEIENVNAIKMELEGFANSIRTQTKPDVGLSEAVRALELAFRISESIDENLAKQLG